MSPHRGQSRAALEGKPVPLRADESRRIAVENDPTVQKAMESMPKAKALLMSKNRVIVQRLSK